MEDALVLKADPSFVERDVIVQIVAGDAQMYRQLVDRYHRGLVNYLVNVLGDADQAEDIAQEAFVQAYRKLHQYNPDYAFSTWLYRIASRLSYRHLSTEKHAIPIDELAEQLPDEHSPDVGAALDRQTDAAAIRAAVARLEPHYRQVIALYYWQERSYQEIADIMDRPLNTVRTWIYRAKDDLRKELDGQI